MGEKGNVSSIADSAKRVSTGESAARRLSMPEAAGAPPTVGSPASHPPPGQHGMGLSGLIGGDDQGDDPPTA